MNNKSIHITKTRKIIYWILLIVISTLVGRYLGNMMFRPDSSNIDKEWKELTWNEGNFKILMPGVPAIKTEKERMGDTILPFRFFISDISSKSNKNRVYTIGFANYANDSLTAEQLNQIYQKAAESAVKVNNGIFFKEITKENSTNFSGVNFQVFALKEGLVLHYRLGFIKNRFYIMQVITDTKDKDDPDVERFLSSFSILQ